MDSPNMYVNNNTYYSTVKQYEELHQAAGVAAQKLATAKAAVSEQEVLSQQDMQESLNRINALKAEFESQNTAVAEKMSKLEEEIRLELGRIKVWYKEELDKMNDIVGNLSDNVSNLDAKFKTFKDFVSGRLAAIEGEITAKRMQAELHFKELINLQENLKELHIDKLQPLVQAEYEGVLKDVETDISNKSYEAAIGLAQAYIAQGNTVQKELEALNIRYETARKEALEMVEDMRTETESLRNRDLNRMSICEKPKIVFDGEIDYWTEGIFEEKIREFSGIHRELTEDFLPNMKIQQIEEDVSKLEKLKVELDKCVERAKEEYTEYFYVNDLAERIMTQLSDTSWRITRDSFTEADRRKAYNIYANNGSGKNLAIVILQQRELLGVDRKGKKKYGKTQFRMTVESDNSGDVEDEESCGIAFAGVMSMISEIEDISRCNKENNKKVSGEDTEAFVLRYNEESDKAKHTRFVEAGI